MERLTRDFGPIALRSPLFTFHQTKYYEPTMGGGLQKQLCGFEQLVPPEQLPRIKQRTNDLETELAGTGRFPEPRPLNLDPGLLTLGCFKSGNRYLKNNGDGTFTDASERLGFHQKVFNSRGLALADVNRDGVPDLLLANVRESPDER